MSAMSVLITVVCAFLLHSWCCSDVESGVLCGVYILVWVFDFPLVRFVDPGAGGTVHLLCLVTG